MIIRFTPEADTELDEARHWYAHQREDLDFEFMQSIDDALSRSLLIPTNIQTFIERSDARWFAVFRSRSFMRLRKMRLRL